MPMTLHQFRCGFCAVAAAVAALFTAGSVLAQSSQGGTDQNETTKRGAEGAAEKSESSAGGSTKPRLGAILPLFGPITDVTVESLRRRIDEARAKGVSVIVVELDTPGGLVTSTLAITDMLKSLTDMRSVAWVNPNAHSGGAAVAVACEEIVMARSSRIGDSQVILSTNDGVSAVPEDLRAKVYTPVIAEFRASATLRGYSQVLCEAFVIPEREVWWLEHKTTGEREFVFLEEKIRRMGDEPSKNASPADSEWKLVSSYHNILLGKDVDVLQPIERSDQLLEMSAAEAYAYGFSKGVVDDEKDLMARYDVASFVRFEPTWSEQLAYWLTSAYVRGFLMVVFMLSIYVEFHTPGLGLAGLVALICLCVFVGAPYLTGLANVWEVLLIVAGLALIAVEIFLLPGFGVPGIAGVLFLIVGFLATFAPPEPGRIFPLQLPTMEATMEGIRQGVMVFTTSLVVSLIGMLMLSRYLPRAPLFRRLIPANPTPSQVMMDDPYHGAARVADVGIALGPLRPAGKSRFGGTIVDVVTRGEFVEPGTKVEVIERRGNRVVVRSVVQANRDV